MASVPENQIDSETPAFSETDAAPAQAESHEGEEQQQQPQVYQDEQQQPPVYQEEQQQPPVYQDEQQQPPVYQDEQQQPPVYQDEQQQPPVYQEEQQQPPVNQEEQQQPPVYQEEQQQPSVYQEEQPQPSVYQEEQPQHPVYQEEQQQHQAYQEDNQDRQVYQEEPQQHQSYQEEHQQHQVYQEEQQQHQVYQEDQQRQVYPEQSQQPAYQYQEHHQEAKQEQEAHKYQDTPAGNNNSHHASEVADHDHLNSDEGKLFLGGLSWDTTEEKLKEHFSKYGLIHDVVVMREPMTNRSRGFGFVHFLSSAVAGQALLEDHVIDGKTIDAKKAVPKGTHAEKYEKSTKIFVGGISHMVTEEDLMNCFTKFGNVVSANLMFDKDSGKPRGFGFVEFSDISSVSAVMSAGPITLGDKTVSKPPNTTNLKVDIKNAQPRYRGSGMNRGGSSYNRHNGPSSTRGGRSSYGGPPYGSRHSGGYSAPPQQPAPYRGYNGGSRYGMVTGAPRSDGYGATAYGYGAYGYPYGQPAAQPTASYGRYPSQSQRPMYGGYDAAAAAPVAYDPYGRVYQQPAAVPAHPREADPYGAQVAAQAYGAAARGRYPSRPQPRPSYGYHPYTR